MSIFSFFLHIYAISLQIRVFCRCDTRAVIVVKFDSRLSRTNVSAVAFFINALSARKRRASLRLALIILRFCVRGFSGKSVVCGCEMPAPRVTRKQSSESSKEEEKIRLVLQEINSKLKTVVQNKENVNAALTPIQSLIDRNKLSIGCKLSGPLRGKVIAMYTNAKKACEEEEQLLRKLLSKIDEIHNMQYQMRRTSQMRRGALMQLLMYHARTMRLWIGPLDTHPPALVGAIGYPDSLPIKVGSEVAAFISDIWMLAEVVSVNASGVYEVKDVDDEQKAKYTVRRSRLIPLPLWRADPLRDGHALFPVNAIVLALYPQTTCFYKGVVERVPEKASDDYLVAFEDSSFAQGFSPPLPVPQRFIIAHKIPRPYKRKANHSCDED